LAAGKAWALGFLPQQLRFACCRKGFLRLIKNIEMHECEYVLRLASLALAMQ